MTNSRLAGRTVGEQIDGTAGLLECGDGILGIKLLKQGKGRLDFTQRGEVTRTAIALQSPGKPTLGSDGPCDRDGARCGRFYDGRESNLRVGRLGG